MEKNENLKDEQVQHISGGENNETDIESWDQPNPYNDRPDLNPDGIPVSKLIKKKNKTVCPNCGHYMMVQIHGDDNGKKHYRCLRCNTEFDK